MNTFCVVVYLGFGSGYKRPTLQNKKFNTSKILHCGSENQRILSFYYYSLLLRFSSFFFVFSVIWYTHNQLLDICTLYRMDLGRMHYQWLARYNSAYVSIEYRLHIDYYAIHKVCCVRAYFHQDYKLLSILVHTLHSSDQSYTLDHILCSKLTLHKQLHV